MFFVFNGTWSAGSLRQGEKLARSRWRSLRAWVVCLALLVLPGARSLLGQPPEAGRATLENARITERTPRERSFEAYLARLPEEKLKAIGLRPGDDELDSRPLLGEGGIVRQIYERNLARRGRLVPRTERPASADRRLYNTAGLDGVRKLLVMSHGGAGAIIGMFDAETGAFIDTVVEGNAGVHNARDLAIGPDGHVYVANTGSDVGGSPVENSVLRYHGRTFEPLPGPLGAEGTAEFVPSESAGLWYPQGIAFGADGNIYVVSYTVLRFAGPTPAGDCSGFVPGSPCPGPLGADGTAEFVPEGTGGLLEPGYLAFGPDGHLYVTDADGKVLRFDGQTGAFLDLFASDCQGPPPVENLCEDALELVHPGSDPVNDITLDYDLRCATASGIPSDIEVYRDVWYRYQPPCTGTLIVDTCDEWNFDNAIEIHDGGAECVCPSDSSTRINPFIDQNTCGISGGPESVAAQVVEDGCYLLRIAGVSLEHGMGSMRVSISCGTAAAGPSASATSTAGTGEEDPRKDCGEVLLNGLGVVLFGPDEDLYVVSGGNDRIAHFDGQSGALIDQSICPTPAWPTCSRFGPDGRLYVGTGPGPVAAVIRYDLGSGEPGEVVLDNAHLNGTVAHMLFLPLCGDGTCEYGEHPCNCPQDCPPPPGFDDCNANGVPDDCEPDEDCNANGVRDICDIGAGTSDDCNENLVPDDCEPDEDCNGNGTQDICDIASGMIGDCNGNAIPDDCEADCNANAVPDDCDTASGTSQDCNGNAVPDDCDISTGTSPDGDGGGVPDECERPVLYVDAGATGANNGTSWADAYLDLQDALATAHATSVVSEIRIAAGTYRPDKGTGDRSMSFAMRSGLRIIGGFAGSAGEDPDERDLARFETILSGDLNGDDIFVEPGPGGGEADDFCENAGPIYTGDTEFDTTGATTDGPNPVDCEYGPDFLEADIWYVYTNTCPTSHVQIGVCEHQFELNEWIDPFIAVYEGNTCPPAEHAACADDGCGFGSMLELETEPGATYLLRVGGWGGSSGRGVINIRCLNADTASSIVGMEENSYHVVVADGVDASAVLDGLTVTGGRANGLGEDSSGAGILISEGAGTFRSCRMMRNVCDGGGGGANQTGEGTSFIDCAFVENNALAGAAVMADGEFVNCAFERNETTAAPFAVITGTVRNCVFRENRCVLSLGWGGVTAGGPLVISHSLFEGNVAGRGAAYYKHLDGRVEFESCIFHNNRAYRQGGAITLQGESHATIRNSVFQNNYALFYGGAAYGLWGASMEIYGSLFVGNASYFGGGAISNLYADTLTVDRSTFLGNSTMVGPPFDGGGGIQVLAGSADVSNSILWGNSDLSGTGASAQILLTIGALAVDHSCIQGLTAHLGGEGNIGKSPMLTPDGHLRAGSPCIDAGDPDYTLDRAWPFDVDGDLRVINDRIDIGADEFSDLDLDRLPDWWELKHFHSQADGLATDDTDNDGLTNLDEYERYGSNPIARPYFVSGTTGRDDNDGLAATSEGHGVGPKRTIQAALVVADEGDTVVVLPQNRPYKGEGNRELDFKDKSVVVRSSEGPEATVLDLDYSGQAVNLQSVRGTFATLDGFTITHGDAFLGGGLQTEQSNLQIRDCVLDASSAVAGGGVFTEGSHPTIDDLTLTDNTGFFGDAGLFSNTSVNLEGALTLATGVTMVFSSRFDGPGYVELGDEALLHIVGDPGADPTVLRSDLVGNGDVLIDLGQELQVDGGATVDLGGGRPNGSYTEPGSLDNRGTIWVDGELYVRDATVQNTNIKVSIADFIGTTDIINNDIAFLNASTGFGGQFFVDGTAIVKKNAITSEGDRYLDLDPDPNADPRPTIEDNEFHVIVTQGAEGEQGEILELRIEDFDCDPQVDPEGCPSGAVELPASTGYDDTWALETLRLEPGSKVTLTNRQGLVFQDPAITTPETVYVKDLVLSSDSVLNVGLQRLYYKSLMDENGVGLVPDPEDPAAPMANGSRIVDVPLLGFSLGIISMNDDTEFDVRVRTRTTDPADFNPDDPFAELPQGVVRRLVGQDPDPDGFLNLRTFGASSVSAKGAFARATEDSIIVSFQYLFRDNPGAELVVYLSDVADPGSTGCPVDQSPCCDLDPSHPLYDEHRCEIARVYPPPVGRRGAIGSEEFATFHGSFPKGDLNFIRGTYVELELRNAGSRVWIDEWDPVICSFVCGAFTGEHFVLGHADYLYLLSDYGQQVRGSDQECADSPLNGDGYVGLSDLLAWELYYAGDGLFNLCGNGTTASDAASATPADVPAGTLLIAGKRAQGLEDALYTLDANGACTGDRLSPASTPSPNGYRGNGRLIRDGSGELYQLHSVQGLIRLSDAEVVIPPSGQALAFGDKQVLVGTWAPNGRPRGVPMQDVAFHPANDSILYVAPVLVEPPGGDPYKTAVRLRLTDGPEHFVIEQLYGQQPVNGDGCCNTDPCSASECSVNHPREIEVAGGRVFITSSRINGDDWLLVFDEATGAERARIPLSVPSPTALTLSSTGQIYMASAMEDDDSTGTELYRYKLIDSGGDPALVLDSLIRIDHMRQVTAVAENPEGSALWVIGFDAPDFDDYDAFYDEDPLFTTPMLAMVAAGATSAAATEITCHDLALPLSMVFNMACTASADTEPDGDIDLRDFASFQQCMTGPGGEHGGSSCTVLDTDCDGDIDQLDYKLIANRLTDPAQ